MTRPVLSPHLLSWFGFFGSDRSIPLSKQAESNPSLAHHPYLVVLDKHQSLGRSPKGSLQRFLFRYVASRGFHPLSCQSPMLGSQSPNVWYLNRSFVTTFQLQHPAPTNQTCHSLEQIQHILPVSSPSKSDDNGKSSLWFQALLEFLQKTLGILAETNNSGPPKSTVSVRLPLWENTQVAGLLRNLAYIILKDWNASRERLTYSTKMY